MPTRATWTRGNARRQAAIAFIGDQCQGAGFSHDEIAAADTHFGLAETSRVKSATNQGQFAWIVGQLRARVLRAAC